jgi:quinol monooxygenase YgiN
VTAVLVVRLTVRSCDERRFEDLITELRERSLAAEAGLVTYDYFRGTAPSTYVGIEAFVDQDAFWEHQRSDHHHQLATQLKQVIVDQHVEWVDPLAGAAGLAARTEQALRAWWDEASPAVTCPAVTCPAVT